MAWEYYLVVMLIYLGTDLLAVWGLNLEFGISGIANLAYIVVVAFGAYTYAVCTLGPSSDLGGFQQYIGGFGLPWGVALLIAVMVGALVGAVIGLTGLKRLRQDYQAVAMLVVSLMLATVISADVGIFNGSAGLALIPNPFSDQDPEVARWLYVGLVAVCCLIGLVVLRRFTTGPMGRTLRAMRDDDTAASAAGKNVVGLRLLVQAVGGGFAGLSGALLAGFIGGWSPSAWVYIETLAFLSCIIVGGMGSDRGASVGTVIVAVLLLQGVQFLPQISGSPGLKEDFGWIVLGSATIAFIWFRPQGLLPERRPHYLTSDRRPRFLRRSRQPAPTAENG